MAGPKKGERPDMDAKKEMDRVQHKANTLPHLAEGTLGTVIATEKNQASDGQGARSWEILLPNLVTSVSRGEAAADGGPVTKIKYFKPCERDDRHSATFCQAPTESFSCERCADSRLGPGECSRTMLVFAAGVCTREGVQPHGGIGIVTKDTVHFHEAKVQERLLAAADRLYANPNKKPTDEMRKMDIFQSGLDKPARGHSRELVPGGNGELACLFGVVESRYQPSWKTVGDKTINEELYGTWLKPHATVEAGRKMMSMEVGGEATVAAGAKEVAEEVGKTAGEKKVAKGEDDDEQTCEADITSDSRG
ncbi:hypothetical protein N657DRAFT_635349 [Parathielavia appendiculata]|uniref:Uncharacterized protein n=1 Tax=Parathielavia appendiculata TaxID=2587402 RepID=A0AAN6Z1Y1_9PEZI|nr:hypothetical protein N657DRAFT_635349 [Parathielavia appendiculata]